MEALEGGAGRQHLPERIRQHSLAAGAVVKNEGRPNDLIERLQSDPDFAQVDFRRSLDPRQFVGRAPEQVNEFLAEVVQPILDRYGGEAAEQTEIRV